VVGERWKLDTVDHQEIWLGAAVICLFAQPCQFLYSSAVHWKWVQGAGIHDDLLLVSLSRDVVRSQFRQST
jgi:hypothetical protein